VLDALRDDVQLPRAELDVTVAELDRQASGDDEEEVVRVGMRMPDELALDLADLDLVVVVVADDLRLERLVERRELPREIDLVGHALSIWARWSVPE
jgi:hypothetical protein